MADPGGDTNTKQEDLEIEVQDMNLKEEQADDVDMDTIVVAEVVKEEHSGSTDHSGSATPKVKRHSRSPVKADPAVASFAAGLRDEDTEIVGGEVELKLESGNRPKLVRKQSQKVKARPPQLFTEYDDKTVEATSVFSVIKDCIYAAKYMGATDPALECECQEEWGEYLPPSHSTTRHI
jgi:hypothetical protein